MIVATGIDLVETERIRGMLERHGERFLHRVFTPEEQRLAPATDPALFYAGRWAAKEAVSKVLGTGIGDQCSWTDIVVLRGEGGKPVVEMRGVGARTAAGLGIACIHVSLTHVQGLACATATAEAAVGNGGSQQLKEKEKSPEAAPPPAQVHAETVHAMECSGRLADGVAHSFNNFLTPILGYVDLLQGQLGMPESWLSQLQCVADAAEQAQAYAQQLQLLGHRLEVKFKPLMPDTVIAASIPGLQESLGAEVTLLFYGGAGDAILSGDAHLWGILLQNLCQAGKCALGKTGGMLELTTDRVTVTAGENLGPLPGSMPPGGYVRLCMRHSGAWAVKQVDEHFFEPFVMGRVAGRNTGLELAIVYNVVSKHRGFALAKMLPNNGGGVCELYFPESF